MSTEREALLRGLLRGYHTVTRLPVRGDQDAFGHVNNVVYFRWLESARIDLLAAIVTVCQCTSFSYVLLTIKTDADQPINTVAA
jgi:acyl-CoA thioesterase FadM